MEVLIKAAKFYLNYCGQRGTDKQVEKLLKQVGPSIVRMATDRGFKAE
jgi:hypothetical protein